MKPSVQQFIVVTTNREGSEELRWALRKCSQAEVFCGPFTDIPQYDCIATAGNSFGLMDAGMDRAVLGFFGHELQDRIQQVIVESYFGEQPVGTAVLVPSGHRMHRWVAHAPTMRIPMNIAGTDHVYLAAAATVREAHAANAQRDARITTLVLPAFGTGTGGMTHLEAGTQIRIAIEAYLNAPEYINPSFAQSRAERVHYGGRWGFEHPRPIE